MLLFQLMARRFEKAKNNKVNITIFSASMLCLTQHWTIPISVSVRARESTRPISPGFKAKQGRRRIKSEWFLNPCSAPSVTLQRRFLYHISIIHMSWSYYSYFYYVDWDHNTVGKMTMKDCEMCLLIPSGLTYMWQYHIGEESSNHSDFHNYVCKNH